MALFYTLSLINLLEIRLDERVCSYGNDWHEDGHDVSVGKQYANVTSHCYTCTFVLAALLTLSHVTIIFFPFILIHLN